jgi:SAM-dependent methyltransferase
MNGSAFRDLRLAEVEDSIRLLDQYGKKLGDLLEIGAGTGWQAKALSRAGFHVEAIDLPADSAISGHAKSREWSITDYDGVHIPFGDDEFDIIYSSNVLEHVTELDALMGEMKRVLRPGGIALHLLPNPQWRLISLLSYYPGQLIDCGRWLRKSREPSSGTRSVGTSRSESLIAKAFRRLVPPTHGAVVTPLSEIARFSKGSWDDYFDRMGWDVVHYGNNGLAASGDYLLGRAMGLGARRRLGKLMGGIAHVFVVRPRVSK